MSTWQAIEALLARDGLNYKQLAAICMVSPSAITKWAKGAAIGSTKLHRIAMHFGVTVESLLAGNPADVPPAAGLKSHTILKPQEKGPTWAAGQERLPQVCRYPEHYDLPARIMAIEDDLKTMRSQMDTLISLLGGALRPAIDKKQQSG